MLSQLLTDAVGDYSDMTYVFASVLFILSLAGLSTQDSAKQGNICGMLGMIVAIIITFFDPQFHSSYFHMFIAFVPAAIVGAVIANKVPMEAMPETVAAFHSFVGLGAVLVGISNYLASEFPPDSSVALHLIEIFVGVYIGGITFTGSVVAFLKLHALISGKPLIVFGRHFLNLGNLLVAIVLAIFFVRAGSTTDGQIYLYIATFLSFFLGFMLVMSIGGADMPVVVSMLNSYSGWACSASGFMLNNPLLIITGALVGSSGAILSYVMCKAMNRSFISVIAGGFGGEGELIVPPEGVVLAHTEITLNDVSRHLKLARNIIIVPGYGMAVARCQNEVAEIALLLRKAGKNVRFCIHPVAGRLPGHMNVLLAEADIPYDMVLEMKDVNRDFPNTDMVLVIGANDIVNPSALDDPNSLIAGMPVCEVWKAKECIVFKRSLRTGYAGIENMLFYKDVTKMCFGDAKDTMHTLLKELETSGGYIPPEIPHRVDGYTRLLPSKDEVKALPKPKKHLPPPRLSIGVIKETAKGEKRVSIIPSFVRGFMELGFRVMVEKGAGTAAGFLDSDFQSAGAILVNNAQAWRCEIVMKILPPTSAECNYLLPGSILISLIYPRFNTDIVDLLSKNKVTVFALDMLPRISRGQKMDILSSQNNLAGYRAILEAAALLPRFFSPQMTAGGSFPAAKVLIVGCGVAGLAALVLAKKLGASVCAFDTRPACREQVESLGGEFLEVSIQEDGNGAGGYGKVMSPEYIAAEMELFADLAKKCDVIITTALIPGKPSPILIKTSTARLMKRGSVIVDLGIREGGGNCELTKIGKVINDPESGVNIVGYSISELTSKMAMQASMLLSHNMFNLITEFGGLAFRLDPEDELCKGALVLENGVKAKPKQKELEVIPPSQDIKIQLPATNLLMSVPAISSDKPPAILSERKEPLSTDANISDLQNLLTDVKPPEPFSLLTYISELWGLYDWLVYLLMLGGIFIGIAAGTSHEFHVLFFEFVLACIIGYHVVWSVSPALHTPLMSETNAISGIIVLGSMLEISGSFSQAAVILGVFGVFFASINIVGGFWVTLRMLTMFHK